jgi:hypothetical protein
VLHAAPAPPHDSARAYCRCLYHHLFTPRLPLASVPTLGFDLDFDLDFDFLILILILVFGWWRVVEGFLTSPPCSLRG